MSASTASTIRVITLDHVTIVASDLDRSVAFYRTLLGMEEVPRPNFGFPGRWLQAGSTQIHLNLESPEAGRAGIANPTAPHVSRGLHYAFQVDDCDGAVAQLQQLEIPLAAGPKNRPDGARQVYIRDPDGHVVELFSLPR